MKLRFLCLSLSFCCLVSLAIAAPEDRAAAIKARLGLKVADKDEATDHIIRKAGKAGGYFTSLSANAVAVKIPPSNITAFLNEVSAQGDVVDRVLERLHLGDMMMEKRSALAARETVKQQYMKILESSEVDSILSVEKEVTFLVEEIEKLKGAIRMLEHQMAFAHVEVAFEFRDRSVPVADGTSSFPWLNTVNLIDLLRDF